MDRSEDPALLDAFDLKTPEAALEDQVVHLAKALGTKIEGLQVDTVIVRSADFPPTPRRNQASDKRCMIEGALVYVARAHGASVHVRTGKEVGEHLGQLKADAEARGKELDSKRPEAAAAALSGM